MISTCTTKTTVRHGPCGAGQNFGSETNLLLA